MKKYTVTANRIETPNINFDFEGFDTLEECREWGNKPKLTLYKGEVKHYLVKIYEKDLLDQIDNYEPIEVYEVKR